MYGLKYLNKYVGNSSEVWCFRLVAKDKAKQFNTRDDVVDFISYMGLSIYDSRLEIVKL